MRRSLLRMGWRGGAGHYVKMVHNGIEYGDMQLICEAYNILKRSVGMQRRRTSEIFTEWNKGELNSYLIEITLIFLHSETPMGHLLSIRFSMLQDKKEPANGLASAHLIWHACDLIAEAVFARCLLL